MPLFHLMIYGNQGAQGIHFRQSLQSMGNAFCSCSCGHRTLKTCRCRFHRFAELLGHCAGHKPAENVSCHNAPDLSAWFLATLIFPNESRHSLMGVPLLSPFALPSRTDCGCHGTDPKVVR